MLRSPSFDPASVAVVAEAIPELESAAPDTRRSVGDSHIERFLPEEVDLRATCLAPRCLVVLSDFLYPGWEARVDGKSVPIHQTNGLFRGVEIETGEHRIEYRYRPLSPIGPTE